jgi:hypothetical protein
VDGFRATRARPLMDSHMHLWPAFDPCVELNFKPWRQASKEIKSMPLATTLYRRVEWGCTCYWINIWHKRDFLYSFFIIVIGFLDYI